MGNSQPPPTQVDLVDSYARLVGDEVEIVLADPALDVPADGIVVLRQGKRRRDARHRLVEDEAGRRLVARIERARLGDGIWALRLRTSEGSTHWGCRLLVQGRRPLVLLWGSSSPASTLPDPHPRDDRSSAKRAAALGRRAAARAVREARSVSGRLRRG